MDQQLRDFIAVCGRMPDPHSPLQAEAELALRTGSAGHQHVVTDLFLLRLQHVNTLLRAEGRWPSRTAADGYEASLGAWLSHIRVGRIKLGGRRRELIEMLAPGWQEPYELAWESRLMQLTAFVRDRGRFPSRSSSDPFEASLAEWRYGQRRFMRSGSLRAPRVAMLVEAESLLVEKAAA